MLWDSLEALQQGASNEYEGIKVTTYVFDDLIPVFMLWYSLEALQQGASNEYGKVIKNMWYSLEALQQGASNEYHNICFWGELK